jgi:hypothetical protein
MTVLRNIEAKIESLFEGVFGRAFRTNVQPVELARKLVKEMEDHRVISVSRLYVPNEYTVYLSPQDREQFASYEESLLGELQDYLAENARREKYVMLSPPKVLMETDEDLEVGEFGIATRMAQGSGPQPVRTKRRLPMSRRARRWSTSPSSRHPGGLRTGARARAGDRDALMER